MATGRRPGRSSGDLPHVFERRDRPLAANALPGELAIVRSRECALDFVAARRLAPVDVLGPEVAFGDWTARRIGNDSVLTERGEVDHEVEALYEWILG